MARFSSSVVRSTSVAWKAEALPTSVITAAPESSRAFRPASVSAFAPLRRVMPKAQTLVALQAQRADPLEVLEVLLVRGRIAALDVIEAEVVEPLRSAPACPGARS